jgi:glycosyltransferase involved in cell wall biosynthesis
MAVREDGGEGRRPRLSVLIPCLNAADTIGEQLEALARQEWAEPWEVVVLDNGSTDETLAVVEPYRGRLPRLRVVEASAKRGQAHALNRGAAEAEGEWLAFADADDVVGERWLPALAEALAGHEFVAARQEDSLLNEPWVRETRERVFTEGLPQTWFHPRVAFCGAGCIAIHKRLHEQVGGFDESLFLQDLDYCIRLQLAGAELHFAREAVVHCRYRNSLGGIFRQAHRYGRGVAEVQRRYKRPGERSTSKSRWLLSGWTPMLSRVARVWRKGDRGKLAWQLGWQLGRFRGSVQHRVLAV